MAGEHEPKTLYGAVLQWVGTQPFNNLITAVLMVEIGLVGYATWLFATTEFPKQLEQVKGGYKDQAEIHERVVDKLIQSWKTEREIDRQHAREMVDVIRGYESRSLSVEK